MDFQRIAIIGAGGLSSKRIYPYIGAAGAQLVGVCDLDRGKAERNTALEDFVQAVSEGRTTSRSSIFESYKSMVFYEAILESVESGQPVRPAYEEI